MEALIRKTKNSLATSGGFSIAVGATLIAVAIPLGVLSIINGAKLIHLRKQL